MAEHRQEFDRDLEAIEAKVIELFAMVAEDLPEATRALLNGDREVVRVLRERGQVIDALYPEIEDLVNRQILLQAPVASDLRFLLSVLRIVPELSRSHHLVVSIAAGPTTSSARISRRAAAGSSSGWAPSPPRCGARRRTPGTSVTARPRRGLTSATTRWTSCTPA